MKNYKKISHTFLPKASETYDGYPNLTSSGYVRYWSDTLCAGWSASGWVPRVWSEMRLSRWYNHITQHGLYVVEYYEDDTLLHYHYMSEGPDIEVNKSKTTHPLLRKSLKEIKY